MSEYNNNNYENNNSYSYQGYSNNQQNTNPYYSYYSSYNQNYDDLKDILFYSERYEKPRKGKIREMILPF